ncbi:MULTISPECIES: XdhC family protein [Deferrisoma]
MENQVDLFADALARLERGEAACLATVVAAADPALVGAKVLVGPDGRARGTTGDPTLDGRIREAAAECLEAGRRGWAEMPEGVRVFFDVLRPEASVLLCGAGHIAVPLARFAREVGFGVTVLDDRPDFANPERFPGCRVIARDFREALAEMPLGPHWHVVVITRGHEHDADCLELVLRKPTAYVGLIGSRRRVRFVLDMLGRQGIPRERLEDVFTPIGLPIGAESPEEIALSIASELVCVRRKGPGQARALRGAVGGGA